MRNTEHINPGDLLLFRSSGSLTDKLIVLATQGPFCHVEIAINDTWMIGAHVTGISKGLIPLSGYSVVDLGAYATDQSIAQGLLWAIQEVGVPYGWTDIFTQTLKFLWPNNPLRLGIEGQWDCSDFCTRFLLKCGIALPDDWNDPYSISPNDIGRIFGLVPTRKENTPGIPIAVRKVSA